MTESAGGQRVLITGIAGFAGSHLAELLVGAGCEVTGISYPGYSLHRISRLLERVDLFQADINSYPEVREVFRINRPERVYHLAAVSSVHQSWQNRRRALETNILGSLNILEAARQAAEPPRVLLVSSSEVYGSVPEEDQPLVEAYPPLPASPYAASKAALELLGGQYARADGLYTVILRAFNHTGPAQEEAFVCSSFARQIAEAEQGMRQPVIETGNLEARRDYSDVRDVVAAYREALESCEPGGVYNVCSGRAWSVRELLDILLGMSTVPVTVRQAEERLRPVDVPLLLGSRRRLSEETGWEPRIPMETTLRDLLDYWRENCRRPVEIVFPR